MVTGFEKQTYELTDYELNQVLPKMVAGLATKIGKNNAITSKQAIKRLTSPPYNLKVNDARWRKVVHHIRVNHIVPRLKATSSGYYITNSQKELELYVQSLTERINSITEIRNALLKDLEQMKQPIQTSLL